MAEPSLPCSCSLKTFRKSTFYNSPLAKSQTAASNYLRRQEVDPNEINRHTYDGNPRNASELKFDANTPNFTSGFEAGYKFEQTVWGTDNYKPSDEWDNAVINVTKRTDPGVMEDVIEHANASELPTVPSAANTSGTSGSTSGGGKAKPKKNN